MNAKVKKLGEGEGVGGEDISRGISMMREEETTDAATGGAAIKEGEEDDELYSGTAVEGIGDDRMSESSTANEDAGSNSLNSPSSGGKGVEEEVERYDEEEQPLIDDGDNDDGDDDNDNDDDDDGDINTINMDDIERNSEFEHGRTIPTGIGIGAADGNIATTITRQSQIRPPPLSSTSTSNSYLEAEESGTGVDDGAAARVVEISPHVSPSEPEPRRDGDNSCAVSSLAFMSGSGPDGDRGGGSNKPGQTEASVEGVMPGGEVDRDDGIQKPPVVDLAEEEDAENNSNRPIRELKVEDALLYLDQVKIEFGDQPEIYNEFLDIMKNFKEQNIDTPGVINRVSSLFRGYNKLVLGFNTFLPEGYKIELRDIEAMNRAHEAHKAKIHGANLAATAADIIEAARMSKASGTPLSLGLSHQRGLGHVIASKIDQPTPLYGIMGSGVPRAVGARMGLPSHLSALSGTIKSPLDSGVGLSLLPTVSMCSPQYPMQGGPMPHAATPKTGGPPHQQLMAMGSGRIGGGMHPTSGKLSGVREQPMEYDQPTISGYGTGPRMTGPITGVVSGGEQPAEFDHAISYVTTIKKRFIGEPQTYKAFLEILHKYQKEQKGIKEVLEQVSALFADHPDLLREFTYFLPDPVQDQARERLNRAAKESEMRRVAQQMAYTTEREEDWGGSGGKPTGAPLRGKGKDRKPRGRIAGGSGYPYGTGNAYSSSGVSGSNREGGEGTWQHGGGVRSSRTFSASNRPRGVERSSGDYSRVTSSDSASLGPSAGITKDGKHVKEKPGSKFGGGGGLYTMPPKQSSKRPERVLFAAVKEILTAQGCEPWQEFLKCVELYSIEVLTRVETLALVVDLFGPHTDLYADFKQLMEAIDGGSGGQLQTDMWYSTPLSEVDFSQCRKCTPSYRALPKDYPLPASPERTVSDQSVLNDTFVSVPVGSEEAYSFKQHRRNQYEEGLFAYEDERFEVDIIIDSTISTIKLLDPVVEEISQLQAQWGDETKETSLDAGAGLSNSSADNVAEGVGSGSGNTSSAAGGGGVSKFGRFQYKLDRRAFGTVHLAAMARVYGEHGAEMLELLRKNPAGCIPIVTKRLKQKLIEWQKVRNDLNRQCQEVVQDIYYKSLDRRSYFFKQQEKKSLSSKALIHHIKELHAKSSEQQSQPQLTAPAGERGEMEENNGGEETVKEEEKENQNGEAVRECGGDKVIDPSENGKKQRDRPERKMKFNVSDLRAQWDAFRLVNAAIDHVSQGEPERERLRGVWKDTTHKWLGLPQYLQYHHDLAEGHIGHHGSVPIPSDYPVNSKGRGNSTTAANGGNSSPSRNAPRRLPVGTRVMTSFGEGIVKGTGSLLYPPDEGKIFLLVDLNYATSTLAPDSILGLLPQQDGGGERNSGSGRKRQRGKKCVDVSASVPLTKCTKDNSSRMGKEDMFLGSADFYVLLRLWQVLVCRLKQARTLCPVNGSFPHMYPKHHPMKPIGPNGQILSPKEHLAMKIDQYGKSIGLSPSEYPLSGLNSYEGLLVMVVASLPYANDKSCALAGRSKLEDSVQFLIGNDSYMLFTLDKLLLNIARQLQKVCDDESSSTLIEVWNSRRASLEAEGGSGIGGGVGGKGSREAYLSTVGKTLSELQATSGSAVPHDVYSFCVLFENSVCCAPESLTMELLGHIDADGKVLADEDDESEEGEEAVSIGKQSDEAEENDALMEDSSPLMDAEVEGDGVGTSEGNSHNSPSEGCGDDNTAVATTGDAEELGKEARGDDELEDTKATEKKQEDITITTATLPDVQKGRQKRGLNATVPDANNSQQMNNYKDRSSKRRRAES